MSSRDPHSKLKKPDIVNTYHILNGDALKFQFPSDQIEGSLIVARECLVDGPVQGKSLEEFFKNRAAFLDEPGSDDLERYAQKVIPELSKITALDEGEVNLWFEEDLFCQVNFWFVCSLLYKKSVDVFLVLPNTSLHYGFGGLDADGLVRALEQKQKMTPINVNQLATLWFAYRNDNLERLLKLGVQLHSDFPFVMKAIEAHFDRLPGESISGKPERLIAEIIEEKSTTDFPTVFKEFQKRAPIYGFGDIQVKRIFDNVIRKINP